MQWSLPWLVFRLGCSSHQSDRVRLKATAMYLEITRFARPGQESRKSRRIRVALIVLLAPLLKTQAAFAGPSFDCRRAHSPIYLAICSSKAHSRLDKKLGNTFKARILRLSCDDKSIAVAAQRQWVVVRDRNCGAMDEPEMDQCIARMTSLRTTKLKKAMDSDQVVTDYPDEPAEPTLPVNASPECRMYPDLCR